MRRDLLSCGVGYTKKLGICLLSSLLFVGSAQAITLKDALEHAYMNSPALKAKQEEYKQVTENIPAVISSHFLPNITMKSELNLSNSKYRPGLTGTPYTGAAPSKNHTKSTTLSVSQNLFEGGGGIAALSVANDSVNQARSKYWLEEQNFLAESIETYVKYVTAKEKVEATTASVHLTQAARDFAVERFKVGSGTKIDTSAAQSQYSRALYAQSAALAELETARSKFESLFGVEPTGIGMPNIQDDKNMPSTFDDFKRIVMNSNLNLKIAKYTRDANKASVLREASSLLPRVDATVQNTKSKYLPESYDAATPRDAKINSQSYATGISVTVPILSRGGAEYSQVRSAKSKARQAVHALNETNNGVLSSAVQTWEGYQSSKHSLTFAKEALEAKEIEYEGTRSEQAVGVKTMVDVLKTEKELLEARLEYISAQSNAVMSYYALLRVMSSLSPDYLGLNVTKFDPEKELSKVKFKVIGF